MRKMKCVYFDADNTLKSFMCDNIDWGCAKIEQLNAFFGKTFSIEFLMENFLILRSFYEWQHPRKEPNFAKKMQIFLENPFRIIKRALFIRISILI